MYEPFRPHLHQPRAAVAGWALITLMISSTLVTVAANAETCNSDPPPPQPVKMAKIANCGLTLPCLVSGASDAPAVNITNSGGGAAVSGVSATGVGVVGANKTSGNYVELGRTTDALHAVAWKGQAGHFQAPTDDGIASESAASGKSGVYGANSDLNGYGVVGRNTKTASFGYLGGKATGVYGEGLSMSSVGVWGKGTGTGVRGEGFTGVWALANDDRGMGLYAQGGINGPAAVFRGNILVRSIKSGNTVLELGEGLDYAEGFGVSAEAEIGAGSVLVIDPEHPGKLALSTQPYDRRVAGVVAGAKGLHSGVRLSASPSDYPVALAGRVYCSVDASYGAVSPGDLLTSSPTPGHAMVVKDYPRAQGAILGKAMERLAMGQKGQILVLVTLQ